MSRSGKLISLENRLRSWDGRRLSRRSDRIVAGLREEPTRWISRFLTLIWVRILAARRVWTPWRLFCGVPEFLPEFAKGLGRCIAAMEARCFAHGGTTSINTCFGGAGYFRARNRMMAVAHTPGVAEATPVRALSAQMRPTPSRFAMSSSRRFETCSNVSNAQIAVICVANPWALVARESDLRRRRSRVERVP
jgi:hypothetical protein